MGEPKPLLYESPTLRLTEAEAANALVGGIFWTFEDHMGGPPYVANLRDGSRIEFWNQAEADMVALARIQMARAEIAQRIAGATPLTGKP